MHSFISFVLANTATLASSAVTHSFTAPELASIPSNGINLALLNDAISGKVTLEELIEEDAVVDDENRMIVGNDVYKTVELGNGKFIGFEMEVHPRSSNRL